MKEKNTKELNEILGKTHLSDFEKYCAENKESVSDNSEAFSIYVKNLLQEKLSLICPERTDVRLS